MKIRLLTPQRVVVPAGAEIDVDDGRAALLIEIGAAERVDPVIETAVEGSAVETPEKPKRPRNKT